GDGAGAVVGGRGEAHVDDVYPSAAKRDGEFGHDARTVLHRDAQLVHRPALDVRLEQAAAVVAGAVVPGAHGTGIGRTERARDLPEALDRGLHLVGDRGGVLHVDVGPDGGVGAG